MRRLTSSASGAVTLRVLCALASFALAGCQGASSPANSSRSDAAATPAAVAEDGWQPLPPAPLAARHGALAVWVDGSFLVVGGRDSPACPPTADCVAPSEPALRTGARYDTATQAWSPIADAPQPIENASAAVVADSVFVWLPGRLDRPNPIWSLIAYDAATDRWLRPAQPPGGPSHLALASAGTRLAAFAPSHENGEQRDLMYDPARNEWQEIPADPLTPAYDRTVVASGKDLVVVAIRLRPDPGVQPPLYEAAVLEEGSRQWRELGVSEVVGASPHWVATGTTVVNPSLGEADGGEVDGWGRSYPFGGILDAATGTWSPLPQPPAAEAVEVGSLPAAGDELLMVNGSGWAFDPHARSWTRLDLPTHAGEAAQAAAVGNGRYLLWGGVRWSLNGRLTAAGYIWSPPSS